MHCRFPVRAFLEFYQYTNLGDSAAPLIKLWAITCALSNAFIKQRLKHRKRAGTGPLAEP